MRHTPNALLELWVDDAAEKNVLTADDTAIIPDCCHPNVPKRNTNDEIFTRNQMQNRMPRSKRIKFVDIKNLPTKEARRMRSETLTPNRHEIQITEKVEQ